MTTTPRLTAAAVTRVARAATGSDLFTSRTEPSIGVVRVSQRYAVAGALASADTRDRREARARLAAAALMQAGYEVARSGDRLTVTLPEPTEEDSAEHEWAILDQMAEDGLDDGPAAAPVLAEDDCARCGQHVSLGGSIEFVDGHLAHGWDCRAEPVEHVAPSARAEVEQIVVRRDPVTPEQRDAFRRTAHPVRPVDEPVVHLMSDDLLDACGTAAPGGLHLAPSTTPERITCPACLVLAVEEAAADAVVEQDVPPAADERVTVRISARELRAGDEVVDSLGNRQYAAFDTDAGTHIADGRLVRVWTAIRDQEAGLPPVITVPAERELLVLRPVSAEGRELLAALDRI